MPHIKLRVSSQSGYPDLLYSQEWVKVIFLHLWPQKLYRAFRFGSLWPISCSYPRHSQLTRHSLKLANGRIRQSLTALVDRWVMVVWLWCTQSWMANRRLRSGVQALRLASSTWNNSLIMGIYAAASARWKVVVSPPYKHDIYTPVPSVSSPVMNLPALSIQTWYLYSSAKCKQPGDEPSRTFRLIAVHWWMASALNCDQWGSTPRAICIGVATFQQYKVEFRIFWNPEQVQKTLCYRWAATMPQDKIRRTSLLVMSHLSAISNAGVLMQMSYCLKFLLERAHSRQCLQLMK